MKIIHDFSKSDTNLHGTQKKGEPWNQKTVYGWKLKVINLLPGIKNNAHSTTRALWYKRFILYFPNGAWWHFDLGIIK